MQNLTSGPTCQGEREHAGELNVRGVNECAWVVMERGRQRDGNRKVKQVATVSGKKCVMRN